MPAPAKDPDARRKFPTHSLHGSLLALVLALAIFRFFIQDSGDRHHCKALLNEGRWLDDAHTSWQPDGCMLHPYSPKQVTQCLENRQVVFIGDSTVRQVFYAVVKHVDKKVETTAEKHSDRSISAGGIQFDFFWDPFLNGTRAQELFDGRLKSKTGRGGSGSIPTMAVVGGGIWYLRHPDSGGIQSWDRQMERLFQSTKAGVPAIADEVILLPVENAIESRLSPERAATVHGDDIDKMNARITTRLVAAAFEKGPAPGASGGGLAVPRAFNKVIDGLDDETVDGLHFSDTVSKVQASILLNLRCNDALPKKFPFDKTCCFQYPSPNWVQALLLVFLVGYAPLGLYYHSQPEPRVFRYFPDQKYLVPMTVFGFATSLLFVADRTNLFLKENKQYDALTFGVLCLAALAAGCATMKPADKGDLGFLNRDQTDEWKGWMQIAILIYHYVGASKVSGIYNPIRVLVAAYLFMSGYGHLSFFVKKADFGFARVANILIRLNLLTVVLSYLMDTDYLSYYFSPLVTIWFGIIWVTLWAGHKFNGNSAFLVVKLVVAAALTACFFELPGPLEHTFSAINTVFATNWNASEWRFRQTLDMWIVWVGMATALAFLKIKEHRLADDPRWPTWSRLTVIASALAMAAYFAFELTRESKFVYNASHPYVSAVPVLAFIVLRNATPWLRSTSSRFFIYFGQCSLETFIIQFHFFIAGDTRGIIMMIPGGAWMRPLNFVITSLVFVYVSNQVAIATGVLTAMICYVPKPSPSAAAASRLPSSSRDTATSAALGIPADPPSASAASAHPAAGEYVALSTLGGGGSDGADKERERESAGEALAALDAQGRGGALHKVGRVLATDLRVRFAAIFVGLWVLNVVYPA